MRLKSSSTLSIPATEPEDYVLPYTGKILVEDEREIGSFALSICQVGRLLEDGMPYSVFDVLNGTSHSTSE